MDYKYKYLLYKKKYSNLKKKLGVFSNSHQYGGKKFEKGDKMTIIGGQENLMAKTGGKYRLHNFPSGHMLYWGNIPTKGWPDGVIKIHDFLKDFDIWTADVDSSTPLGTTVELYDKTITSYNTKELIKDKEILIKLLESYKVNYEKKGQNYNIMVYIGNRPQDYKIIRNPPSTQKSPSNRKVSNIPSINKSPSNRSSRLKNRSNSPSNRSSRSKNRSNSPSRGRSSITEDINLYDLMSFVYLTDKNKNRLELTPFEPFKSENYFKFDKAKQLFHDTKEFFNATDIFEQDKLIKEIKNNNFRNKDFFSVYNVNMVESFYNIFNISKNDSDQINNFYKGTFYKFGRHVRDYLLFINQAFSSENELDKKLGDIKNMNKLSIVYFEKAIESGLKHSQCYYMCAIVLERSKNLNDLKKAIKYLEKSIQLSTSDWKYNEVKSNKFLRDIKNKQLSFDEGDEVNKNGRALWLIHNYHSVLGFNYIKNKQYTEAKDVLLKAEKMLYVATPREVRWTPNYLCILFYIKKEFKKSINYLNKFIYLLQLNDNYYVNNIDKIPEYKFKYYLEEMNLNYNDFVIKIWDNK